jgi:O-antigen/teichoic acid export membrane protein
MFKNLIDKIKNRFLHSDFQRYYAKSVPGTFAIKIGNALLKMGLSIVLARYLGPSQYGVYSFVLSIIVIMNLPARLGLPQLLVREVAKYEELGHYNYLKGLIRRASQGVFIVSIVLIALAFIVTYFFEESFELSNYKVFQMGLLLVPLIAMISIFQSTLKGLKQVVLGALPEQIIRFGMFFLFVVIFYFLKESMNAFQAMTLHTLGAFVALLSAYFFMTAKLPKGIHQLKAEYKSKLWLKSSVPFMFIGGLQILTQEIDILLLGIMKSSSDTGTYKVAINASRFIFFFSISFNSVLMPIIAKYYYSGQKKRLQNILQKNVLISTAIVLPLVLLLVLKAQWLLSVLWGQEFAEANVSLIILSLSYFFVASTGPKAAVLTMTGHEKYLLRAKIYMLIISTVLKYFLIKHYGMEGAAIGTGISLAIWSTLLVYYGITKAGLDSSIYSFILRSGNKN